MATYKPLTYPKSKEYIDIRMYAKKGWTYKPKLLNQKIFRLSIWAEFMKIQSLQHRQYQNLTLKLRSRKLEDQDLWQIGRALRSSKQIRIMLVDLRMSDEFSNLGFKHFSKKFVFIKNLEVVSLCLKKCYCIEDEGVIHLAKNISRMKSLKSLNLDLEFIPKVSDECMIEINNCLKRLSQLKNFQINLHQSSVTTVGASCLIYSISHLKRLQSITLDFSRCNLDDEIFPILAHTLTDCHQLQSFHLWCNYVDELTGRGLVTLCESIAGLQTVKDFQMYFYNCDKISTENLCEMANILKMQELSKLRLSFYGADFVDMFDLVAYLPNLVELILILNNWQSETEPSIPKGFLAACQNLQKLYLTLENCFEVSDKHVAVLADEISGLSHLDLLHVTFFGCDISKEGMITFMKCLSELTNLENLRLYFERRVVSKELISNLASYLTRMKHMKSLDLTFFCASFLDDEDLTNLADAISNMNELSLLLFQLTGCKELTDDGIKYLVSSLSSLRNLRGLKMDLRGLPELTFEGLDRVIELFGDFLSLIKGRVFFNGNYITSRTLEKLTTVTRHLPKLVCFSLNHQNISSYYYNSSQLFPEYWFTPTF